MVGMRHPFGAHGRRHFQAQLLEDLDRDRWMQASLVRLMLGVARDRETIRKQERAAELSARALRIRLLLEDNKAIV